MMGREARESCLCVVAHACIMMTWRMHHAFALLVERTSHSRPSAHRHDDGQTKSLIFDPIHPQRWAAACTRAAIACVEVASPCACACACACGWVRGCMGVVLHAACAFLAVRLTRATPTPSAMPSLRRRPSPPVRGCLRSPPRNIAGPVRALLDGARADRHGLRSDPRRRLPSVRAACAPPLPGDPRHRLHRLPSLVPHRAWQGRRACQSLTRQPQLAPVSRQPELAPRSCRGLHVARARRLCRLPCLLRRAAPPGLAATRPAPP